MNLLKQLLSLLAVLAIAGCGGGKCDNSTYGGNANASRARPRRLTRSPT
ncbi:MAG: hypothetical protein U1F50_14615 [Rubrivivax sp.]